MAILEMTVDERPVVELYFENAETIRVGRSGVEKIVAYQEPGEMAMVPWFAVYVGGAIRERVNASKVAVVSYFYGPGRES